MCHKDQCLFAEIGLHVRTTISAKMKPYLRLHMTALEKAYKIIKEKGGVPVGEPFTKNKIVHIKVRCAGNYVWEPRIGNLVNRNSWCPHCYGNVAYTINDCQKIAEERGGKVISTKYKGRDENLDWECAFEHQWPATPANIISHGSWCPHCKINVGEELTRATLEEAFPDHKFERTRSVPWMNGYELDGYNKELGIAFEYQGRQHTERVEHFQKTNEAFEAQQKRDAEKRRLCEENKCTLIEVLHTIGYMNIRKHVRGLLSGWNITPNAELKTDTEFYNGVRASNPDQKMRTEHIREVIKRKGGTLITEYIGYRAPITFECGNGHTVTSTPESIDQSPSRGKRFCRECSKTKPKTAEFIQETVNKFGWSLIEIKSELNAGKTRRVAKLKCIKANHEREYRVEEFKRKLRTCIECDADAGNTVAARKSSAVRKKVATAVTTTAAAAPAVLPNRPIVPYPNPRTKTIRPNAIVFTAKSNTVIISTKPKTVADSLACCTSAAASGKDNILQKITKVKNSAVSMAGHKK